MTKPKKPFDSSEGWTVGKSWTITECVPSPAMERGCAVSVLDLEKYASERNLIMTKLGGRYYFLPKDLP